ncbi:nitrogen regulation protein NR(I) [Alphaproteobacteria bacterium LSUCC0684]
MEAGKMTEHARILLADDDHAIRLVATTALEKAGYSVHAVSTLSGVMEALSHETYPVLVSDVVYPDGDALDVLPEIKASHPGLRIIMMSARSTLLTALKAQEGEVFAYLPKPFPLDDLVNAVADAYRSIPSAMPEDGGADTEGAPAGNAQFDQGPLIGRSPAMQGIFRSMARLINTDLSVMITGESGTGKEVVARALHDLGHRKSGPFVAINMAAIPRDLIESELFGHERGAFTGADRRHEGRFAQARGGTLFLDEIGDMPPEAQTRLLRVLQDGAYTRVGGRELLRSDVRIIAATHKDLPEQIRSGQFREDLYYRLNVVPLNLPPLRDRPEDIADLANHFLARGARDGLAEKEFSRDALDLLNTLTWPGNVRELENLVLRLLVLVDDPVIKPADIRALMIQPQRNDEDDAEMVAGSSLASASLAESARFHIDRYFRAHEDDLPPAGLYTRIMAEVEKPLIEETLRATSGNQLKAADLLGLNRNTLRKKIRELGITFTGQRRQARR